ncbi:MAG: anaerobic ribonucleoside-triphosphate reductase activating protein [Bacillota bacterium]
MIDVAGIVRDSITDGPGIRYTLFVQGCPHACEKCHNPETHQFGVGTKRSAQEIFDEISKNRLNSGVTLSGGDPVCQAKELIPLARLIKEAHKDLAMYTGYTFEQLLKLGDDVLELLQYIDTLIDGKFVLSERTLSLPFRGSKNQRIIDVQQSLQKGEAVLDITDRWNPQRY